MKNSSIPAAAVAALLFSSAAANAVSVTSGPLTSTLSTSGTITSISTSFSPKWQFGQILISAETTGNMLTFDMTTAVAAGTPETERDFYWGAGSMFSVDQAPHSQIRLSTWNIHGELTLYDASSNEVIRHVEADRFGYGNETNGTVGFGINGLAFGTPYRVVGTIQANPGHTLVPSTDPACASFDCMGIGTDNFKISFSSYAALVSTVPEPSTYGLLMFGLLCLPWRRSIGLARVA